jgi:anti-sigma-K factor RskA
MEASDRTALRQQQLERRRNFWCGAASVAVVIIVLVVGLVAGLTQRNKSHGSSSDLRTQILMPLYMYPADGAWDP